jgi:hypothetical protein
VVHVEPPQSTSVSEPFWTPSGQAAAVQVCAELLHRRLTQSPSIRQALVSAHRVAQFGPPQSTSVSLWFFTESGQLGAAHSSLVVLHLPLWQSALAAQPRPSAHR